MMTLAQVALWLEVEVPEVSCDLLGISIDTRTINEGDLFVALKGPNFDAHHFLDVAVQKGARALVVSSLVDDCPVPQLQVTDTYEALGQISAAYRRQFDIPVVTVTGSCGKTTTKGLLAHILREHYGSVLATEGSLNNHVGTPLTLLHLRPHHRAAVIEIGANHLKEIDVLAAWAQPDVGVITCAAPCHLEGFGDIEGVACGKGEMWAHIPAEGYAVLNADDRFYRLWQDMASHCHQISFGLNNPEADVRAENCHTSDEGYMCFDLLIGAESAQIQLRLMGGHNVANALAAAAVAHSLQVPIASIKKGLEQTQPVAARLQQYQGVEGCTVIDDVYNANPASFEAALNVLSKREGEKVVVMGDMGELGADAEAYHRFVGKLAHDLGIQHFYSCGKLSQSASAAFGDNGHSYEDKQRLVEDLKTHLTAQTTVLVKGSRAAHMEQVVSMLVEDY